MKTMTRCALAVGCLLLLSSTLVAATFVVGSDRDLVQQAPVIVVASALASHAERTDKGGIETVTVLSIEEVLKGSLDGPTVDVREPGGVIGRSYRNIPGVPRFRDGQRYLLFLINAGGAWRVLDLALGKFTFDTDRSGETVLVRDVGQIKGWDADGTPHREPVRTAAGFVNFIRATVSGGPAAESYLIPSHPLSWDMTREANALFRAVPLSIAPSTYTYDYSGGMGARWNTFPSAVTFMTTNANSAAITATANAMASWDANTGSNINLVNGGADTSGTHTGGVLAADGQSTIAFEMDLSNLGAGPISALNCGANFYNGVIGVGAVTNNVGTHVPSFDPTETFASATEGDVEMNRGTSTCSFFISTGDFNTAVAHELGHAMGFRHSDENRTLDSGVACDSSTSDCSTFAVMVGKAEAPFPSGLNGGLQAWDKNAAKAIYPTPACTSPSISSQPAGSTITSGGSAALSVTATGTAPLTYQWYLGVAPDTTNPIGGATTSTYNTGALTSTTSYWVRVSGCSTFVNSNTATVTVLGSPVNSGDVNGSGAVNSADVFYLINYLFAGGPAPVTGAGDPNNDGAKNAGDVIFLLRYLFASGTAPAPAH